MFTKIRRAGRRVYGVLAAAAVAVFVGLSPAQAQDPTPLETLEAEAQAIITEVSGLTRLVLVAALSIFALFFMVMLIKRALRRGS